MTISAGGRRIGPGEQVGLWADQALFGKTAPSPRPDDLALAMSTPDGPTLTEMLAREQARGWLAEGLTRLYIAEGLITRFSGYFERLQVGPATATRMRVAARFILGEHERRAVDIEGMVPLGGR